MVGGALVTPCPACGGTGRKPLPYEPANEAWALSQQPECRACDGTGEEAGSDDAPEPDPAEVTAAARAGRCLPVGTLRVRV